MTYHTGPSIVPEVGGYYELRAGLHALVTEAAHVHGVRLWRGVLFDPEPSIGVWWYRGNYSADAKYKHELDIVTTVEY